MRRPNPRTALTLVVLLGTLYGCGGSAPESSGPASSEPSSTAPGSPPPPTEDDGSQRAAVTIRIADFAYSDPGPVPPGAEVTVENDDDTTHTVTAEDAGGFDVTVPPGEARTFTAPSEPGATPSRAPSTPT